MSNWEGGAPRKGVEDTDVYFSGPGVDQLGASELLNERLSCSASVEQYLSLSSEEHTCLL